MMADGRSKQGIPGRDEAAPGPTPQNSAEAKRLQARRRFLLGGAAALPVILHVTAIGAAKHPDVPTIGGSGYCFSFTGGVQAQWDGSLTLFVCAPPK